MKNKKTGHPPHLHDLLVVSILPILAALASWVWPLNFAESSFLFFGLPALYLSWRKPNFVKRALFFSFIFTIIAGCIDYAAIGDHSWFVPTVFHVRIAGTVPIEDLIWAFLLNYMIIAFFETFYDHLTHKVIGRRMPYLYLIAIATLCWLVLSSLIGGHPYDISYFYLKAGLLLCALPIAVFLFEFPRFMSVFLTMTPYFASVSLIEEIVGLHGGYWYFPGNHFIGWVNFGTYRFPYEELIFWIVLFCSAIVTYFEVFDDNRLKLKLSPARIRR